MDSGLSLEQRLLVRVARQLGPVLDQVDIVSNPGTVMVRELLVEFSKPDGPRPVEVRMALASLGKQGLLVVSSGELGTPQDFVSLTMGGLLAAREIVPACGLPTGVVRLVMRRGKRAGVFDARIDTGKSSDELINRSGLCLAAFYVLAAKRPTKGRPVMLADCEPFFCRLAALGVGPRSGKGTRLLPTRESISEAFEDISRHVVRLRRVAGEDGREVGWHLARQFPEVRIEGASGKQFRDWMWMQRNLTNAITGYPFPDGVHDMVRPMTDEQVRALQAERDAEEERRREEKREMRKQSSKLRFAREDERSAKNADE